jgi:hypothetical protein
MEIIWYEKFYEVLGRHSRESGNPRRFWGDSRLRGNDVLRRDFYGKVSHKAAILHSSRLIYRFNISFRNIPLHARKPR